MDRVVEEQDISDWRNGRGMGSKEAWKEGKQMRMREGEMKEFLKK